MPINRGLVSSNKTTASTGKNTIEGETNRRKGQSISDIFKHYGVGQGEQKTHLQHQNRLFMGAEIEKIYSPFRKARECPE